jgi:hypothetical protein
LGHAKLDTNAIYTRVATKTIQEVTSPLEHLIPKPGEIRPHTQTDQPTTLAVPSNSAESTKHTRSTDQAEPRKQAKSTKQPKLKNRGKPTKLAKIRKQRKPPLDARGTWPLDKVKKPVPEFLCPS